MTADDRVAAEEQRQAKQGVLVGQILIGVGNGLTSAFPLMAILLGMHGAIEYFGEVLIRTGYRTLSPEAAKASLAFLKSMLKDLEEAFEDADRANVVALGITESARKN